jgi:DNA-binding beta-propeller fold protein YncE
VKFLRHRTNDEILWASFEYSVIGPNETYQPVSVRSTNLTGNGKLNVPTGLAVDSPGNIYVADSGNDCIQKFDSNGTFITKWGATIVPFLLWVH